MSKIHFNNTFSSGCVQFVASDWPATTAYKMIYLLTSLSYTVVYVDPNVAKHNSSAWRHKSYQFC